jgi:predicted outer membrane protein
MKYLVAMLLLAVPVLALSVDSNNDASQELKMKSGESFDESYIENQIKAHEQTVALFQKKIDSGKNASAQEFRSQGRARWPLAIRERFS